MSDLGLSIPGLSYSGRRSEPIPAQSGLGLRASEIRGRAGFLKEIEHAGRRSAQITGCHGAKVICADYLIEAQIKEKETILQDVLNGGLKA